jgi:hypothetical protein
VARAALDGLDLGAGDQRQHVPRLQADVLHALVARDVIGDLAEADREVGVQQPGLVAQHQVLEGIEERLPELHVGDRPGTSAAAPA